MEIKQLQATLEFLKKEKEGPLPGSHLDLDNNAFKVDYLDDKVLQKPQVLNLVQEVNKLNDVLGNKKCLSLLETMGLARPETSDQPASITHKTPHKSLEVIQVMSTSDVSDTSDEESGQASSDDSEDGRKVKKKGKKKKLKSAMTLKAKDDGIKVKVKWAQSMLGTKKRLILMILKNETRIHLMQRISKLNSKFGFEVAKELYRDTLNGIEKKEFKWGNLTKMQRIEMDIKFDNLKIAACEVKVDGKSKKFSKKVGKDKLPEVVWCKDFNFGWCTFQTHHKGNSMVSKLTNGTSVNLVGMQKMKRRFTRIKVKTAL